MKRLNFYTSNELKPSGWLKRQLTIQAEGLSGNLDKVWRDVRDSAWIGGDAEGWERVPYWLDGFIPLAYLLENEDMIARAGKYIDAIVASQKPDGWICPCSEEKIPTYDTWAVLLISKVLTVYYNCSHDERIPDVLYRTMKNYYDLLSNGTIKLFQWGKYRWYEGFMALNFLAERYDDEWIRDLAKILKSQGTDYSEKIELWKRPLNKWTLDTHIVNLMMMLKSEAVSCELLGDEYTDLAERLRTVLDNYNGTPVGLFTGDECLSGISPIQGTELCAVAEMMYSYELLYAYTGDKKWAERLEVVAFNALPATISDDMWTHQYLQMSNQIACVRFPGRSLFRTNNNEAHLFGLEPHFGCCTANFNQAWPKLTLSAFMYSGDTVVSAVPVPTELKADGINITLDTNYPFENKLVYKIDTEKAFTLKVRIPSFAKDLTVCGTPAYAEELSFDLCAGENREITVEFNTACELIDRPHSLKTVKCGSLVFSLPIKYEKVMYEYTKKDVERKFPYCDYEYVPKSEWSYGLDDVKFDVLRHGVSDVPFSSEKPPVTLTASVKKIAWGTEDGFETVCAKIPASTAPMGERETVSLYPYGCAKLRMTELPLVK
ncbi:MAG: glycoside hydrolase family 127 protein [Clostridia bacterium]|nr:glycoside hydrolase family 127 protein [Clostridia bacterium]